VGDLIGLTILDFVALPMAFPVHSSVTATAAGVIPSGRQHARVGQRPRRGPRVPVLSGLSRRVRAPDHDPTMIMRIQQLIRCGNHIIMKIPFDHVSPCRGRRVPARARPLPSPPATEVNRTDWYALKPGGRSRARPR
jgi:hypothetical protein